MGEEINQANIYDGGQFLTFRLEQELFGVPIHSVLEVLDYVPTTKIPGSKSILKGVINLRGAVVPVADIRVKFGMSATVQTPNTCIIVVNVETLTDVGQTTVGVLADQVMEVTDLASSDIQQPPEMGTGIPSHFLRGIGKLGEDFFMMLDVDAIIRADMQSFKTIPES